MKIACNLLPRRPTHGRTLETESVKLARFTRLQNPSVRSGPAFAGDFVDHVMLAFCQIVRVVEMLDALRPIGGHDSQLVPTGRHLLRFTAQIVSPALEPPKHVRLLFPVGRLKPDTTYASTGKTGRYVPAGDCGR